MLSNRIQYFFLRHVLRVRTPRDLIKFVLNTHRDKTLLVQGDKSHRFEDTNNRINKFCNAALSLGLKKGDRIAVHLRNSIEYIEIRLACYKCGFVFCAFIDDFSDDEIIGRLDEIDPKLFIHDARVNLETLQQISEKRGSQVNIQTKGRKAAKVTYEDFIQPHADKEPQIKIKNSELSAIGFTSGSSGKSKAVVWSHLAWITSFFHLFLNSSKSDSKARVLLHAIPFSTAGSLSILPGLASGAKNVILAGFNAELVAETVRKHRVTDMVLPPAFMFELMDHYLKDPFQCDFSSIRNITIGSSPLPASKLKRLVETFGPVFRQSYGMAEVLAPLASIKIENPKTQSDLLLSVGKPIPQLGIKLMPKGNTNFQNIALKSKTAFEGYWIGDGIDRSDFKEGWYVTSDIGRFDANGNLYVSDRARNIVSRKGNEFLCRDIEEIIHQMPDVKDVAISFNDEKLEAWIVPFSDAEVKKDDILSYCSVNIPEWMIPDDVHVRESLPYSSSGKILKSCLEQ